LGEPEPQKADQVSEQHKEPETKTSLRRKTNRKAATVVNHPAAVFAESELDEEDELSPEEEMRESFADLARLLKNIREFIESFRDQEESLRQTCWQETECEAIRDQISGLRTELDWLESDIPSEVVHADA
jgi:hypothetical protein